MATISIEQTQEQAHTFLDSRLESVTALVNARQRVAGLEEQRAQAERVDKRAYVRTTNNGRSGDELKKLGRESTAAGRRRSYARNVSTSRHVELVAVTRADS